VTNFCHGLLAAMVACYMLSFVPGTDTRRLIVSCIVTVGVDVNYQQRAIITALASVTAVAVVIILVFTIFRVYRMQRRASAAVEAGTDSSAAFLAGCDSISATSHSATYDLEGLKVNSLISHGKYGDVYRGMLGANEVAVKVIITCRYLVDLSVCCRS